jgi:DNA-binding CsgD family transcriptional regulator/PAS domain-containing protein
MSLHDPQGRFLGHLASSGTERAVTCLMAAEGDKETSLSKLAAVDPDGTIERGCPPEGREVVLPAEAHILKVSLRTSIGSVWLLNMLRSDPTTPYTAADMDALMAAVPMFEYLLSQDVSSPNGDVDTAGWRILDEFRMGVVLLTSEGSLVAANRKAEELLGGRFGLQLLRGKLALSRVSDNLRFQQAIHRCITSGPHSMSMLAVEAEDGNSVLLVRITWLGTSCNGKGERPHIAILLSDSTSYAQHDPAPLREIYGLTPIEGRLVGLICGGCSPREAATQLGITSNTARGYLKAVFRKMGVHRQTDLIRLTAVFPTRICI